MSSSRKRKRVASPPPPPTVSIPSSQNGRVFTDSDEIRLLETYKKLTEQNPSSSSPSSTPNNTTITVDSETFNRIDSSLASKFTHGQITDKLRRLRIKYHKLARSKSRIKTPHDEALYKTARLIWGKKMNKKEEAMKSQNATSSDEEDNEEEEEEEEAPQQEREQNEEQEREGVKLEKYPVLMDEFSKFCQMNLMWREALKSLGNEKLKEMNQKWAKIGIEEAKIVTMKADLVKEQTQLIMAALGDTTTTTANGNDFDGLL